MTRFNCYICYISKKAKFFPKNQPYPTHKICDKCIAKNLRRNATMIDMITKRTNITPTKEERLAIELSFTTVKELTTLSNENPKAAGIIKDLADCTDKDIIRSTLKKLDISSSATNELIDHFYTVASINKRARENYAAAQQKDNPDTVLTQNTDDSNDGLANELLERAKKDD